MFSCRFQHKRRVGLVSRGEMNQEEALRSLGKAGERAADAGGASSSEEARDGISHVQWSALFPCP